MLMHGTMSCIRLGPEAVPVVGAQVPVVVPMGGGSGAGSGPNGWGLRGAAIGAGSCPKWVGSQG